MKTCPSSEVDTLHGLNLLSRSGHLCESTCQITPVSLGGPKAVCSEAAVRVSGAAETVYYFGR